MIRRRGLRPGSNVLVTGASSGLGRALALELARLGCRLVLTGRNRDRLEAAAAEALRAGSPGSFVLTADLSLEAGIASLLEGLRGLDRPVDALINNAGAGRSGPWASGSAESDQALFRLLAEAPLALTRELLPGWRQRGQGALLNVASTGAFQPGPQTAVYYAAKAFLASWSLALAREERSWLTVTTVCPGALATGFAAAAGKTNVPGAPGPAWTAHAAIRAWNKGRGLVIPGLGNKILVLLSRIAPPTWSAAAVEAVQKSVRPST